jgi:glycosyltransferase involved in cell wall biosynthesis
VKTSFVIIAHNEERHIERTIRSIASQEELGDHEIIVIDDKSSDCTREIVTGLAAEIPAIRLVALPENRGRGYARWTGVREANGDRLATVDADILLPPDWLRRCARDMDGLDAVGGTAVPDGDVAYLYGTFKLEPRPVAHATDITGSNALYRADVFERVRYDPALRNGEDVALGHAMRESGIRTRSLEGVFVRHEESKSLRKSLSWLFESGIGASRQLRRYRQIRQPDLVLAAWLALGPVAGLLASRGRTRTALGLPTAFLLGAAGAHVATRFVWGPGQRLRFAGAVVIDTLLLGAYLSGRVVGLLRHFEDQEGTA